MTKHFVVAIAAALGLFMAAPASARQADDGAGGDTEIVVTSQKLDDLVRSFVGEVTATPRAEDQLARWDRRICPGVVGAPVSTAQALNDQIARRALEVGLKVGEPGCRANVLMLTTSDSDTLATELASRFNRLMGVSSDSGNTLGDTELAAFAASEKPIRWWHVAETVSMTGQRLGEGSTTNATIGDGFSGAQVVRVPTMNRVQRTTRQDFSRVIVILDTERLKGVSFSAMADYVAMVTLAQIDPNGEPEGFKSILNLFAENGDPDLVGMTEWDLAYLQGLYDAPRNARNSREQERAIARSLENAVSPDAE